MNTELDKANLPTIQSRLFSSLVLTGVGMALIAALGIGIADIFSARRMIVENLVHYSEAMSRVSAYNIQDSVELEQHLRDFSGQPGLEVSCIYSAENTLLAAWQYNSSQATNSCQKVIGSTGIRETVFTITIVREIFDDSKKYLGYIYLEGNLRRIESFAIRIVATLLLLAASTVVLCTFIARRVARRISQPMSDIIQHIECLYSESERACALPRTSATYETEKLLAAINRMHEMLASTMMPRDQVDAIIRWHDSKMAGLLALLRSRLSQDSILIPCLTDYTLLLEVRRTGHKQKSSPFDIRAVADRAFSSAKKIQPPGELLHATLSLKQDMPTYWQGDAEQIESLLRHLMLISLKRTRSGMSCLRLEAGKGKNSESILYFSLEDTGSELQTMQINRWMKEALAGATTLQEIVDISWVVVARTVYTLGGEITYTASEGQGLCLSGWLPMAVAEYDTPIVTKRNAAAQGLPPLILMVEDDRVNQQTQRALFEKAKCQIFSVSSGEQALEWAALLPYSLIVLDQILPDMSGTQVAAKLNSMILDNVMPPTPIIALSATHTSQHGDMWQNMQVVSVMTKPLTSDAVKRICHGIQPADATFFVSMGSDVGRELRTVLGAKASGLHEQLYQYLIELCDALRSPHLVPAEAAQRVHAVKSAALTLGYDRLSACLGALEFTMRSGDRIFIEENLAVVIFYLQQAAQQFQNPAQRVALSS